MPCPYSGRGARRHRRIDGGHGGRPHRPDRVPHRGAGRGRRSLDGADARREEPHAGVAVTGGHAATLIVGDGIGPEITQATLLVLDALGVAFDWDEQYGGMSAIDKAGTPLPDATLESIRRTGLALKGPLTTPVGGGYRSVNVALRQQFDLYANVRPVKSIVPGGRYPSVDLVVIRENTEGLYVGIDRTFKVGGVGLAPGANIGETAAIFVPVNGSAPDIAGQGIANPAAQLLAAAMMLDHVGELAAGNRLRRALETAIVKDNVRTKDLGGSASTTEFARAVARRV